jgi:hypothetical protein
MTGLNTEWKIMVREQDSGETERERRGERGRVWLQMNDGIGNKMWPLEKIFMTFLQK